MACGTLIPYELIIATLARSDSSASASSPLTIFRRPSHRVTERRENSEPLRCDWATVCSHSGSASGRSAITSVSIAPIQNTPLSASSSVPPSMASSASSDAASASPASSIQPNATVPWSIFAPGPSPNGSWRSRSERSGPPSTSAPKYIEISSTASRALRSSCSSEGSSASARRATAAASSGPPAKIRVRDRSHAAIARLRGSSSSS